MSPRRAVNDALDRIAFAAELLDDRRARTWRQAAWAVRNSEGDLRELYERGELAELRGVGGSTMRAVGEVLAGGKPAALIAYEAKLPDGLFRIRRIKGLGPKKVKRLWKELGITSLGELEYACRENRLVELDGFGPKTQDKVLQEIARLRATEGMVRRDQAEAVLGPIEHALWVLDTVEQVAVVGDLARGEELVRELAVLAQTRDEAAAAAQLERARPKDRDVTLHLADAATFAARAVWLTSEPGHRAALSERAAARGLAFEADGLRDVDGAPVACEEEDEVYRALGLSPTPRERRRDDVPLAEEGRARPRLVRREDLRGALHNHTVESDGSATLEQMRAAARDAGLEYLHISEHSESAYYARGLEVERLDAQLAQIDALNDDPDGCVLLTGIESDIREDGSLDYPDEVLDRLDVVVASVHRRGPLDAAQMTERMVRAASHRHTDVVGHPTGRLLLGRAPIDFDVEAFLDACAANGVAVELNANPHRLDLNERHLAMAKERGLLVSIAADAHATRELANLEHGVVVARRAGLTPEDVLNTRSLAELKQWIAARRA